MIEFASEIEHVFRIDGRGCVILPGILFDVETNIKIGDHVYFMDDSTCPIDTVIRGIEMTSGPNQKGLPILIPKSIVKEDIPIGGMLYTIGNSPCDGNHAASTYAPEDAVSVRVCVRNKTPQSGVIDRAVWHHKYRLWYYWLRTLDGKSVSKRYTAADLVPNPDV